MPMVEIDETELANFRGLTATVNKIMSNPTSRQMLLKAQKTVDPDVVIPEIDSAKPVLDAVDALNKRLDTMAEESKADKAAREESSRLAALDTRWEKGRAYARTSAGYTDEGLTELEKFMETHGVADHKIAIPAFEREHPPATPVDSSAGGSRFNIFGAERKPDDAITQLLDGKIGEETFLNRAVGETLRDIRGGR